MPHSDQPTQIQIIRPDDWHVHLRDGEVLKTTLQDTARYFGRAIVMPNLLPPVTSVELALQYKARIDQALKATPQQANHNAASFTPLMTLYLTDQTTVEEIQRVHETPEVVALKLYPAGATTNSDAGVTDLNKLTPVLEKMAELQVPLLVHGEVTSPDIDIFDREAVFIDQTLAPLQSRLPELKIVFEHITTQNAVEYVESANQNIAATITAHHLLYNRNHMLVGGIKPHYYCLPILKRNTHQSALIKAATSGNAKFFLGTDSAPHNQHSKEASCGCAGCYTAAHALELYAEVFDQEDALDQLEAFASINGPQFYNMPISQDKITLVKQTQQIPASLPFGDSQVIPLRANESVAWSVVS